MNTEVAERRRSRRTWRVQNVVVRSAEGNCSATVINASPHGLLLGVPTGDRLPSGRLFIHFLDWPQVLQAQVVRSSPAVHSGEELVLLGCQFYRELKMDERDALGIPYPRRRAWWRFRA